MRLVCVVQEFTAAVQFASSFEEVKSQLLATLKDVGRSPSSLIKKGLAALVEGLVSVATPQQVLQKCGVKEIRHAGNNHTDCH